MDEDIIYKNRTNNLIQDYSELTKNLIQEELTQPDGSIYPVSLTPYFISHKRYLQLQEDCDVFCEVIEIIVKLYLDNTENIQDMFPELSLLRELSLIKPPYEKMIQYARFDFIEDKNGNFKMLETNCAGTGGIMLLPTIKSICKKLDSYQSIKKNNIIVPQEIDDKSFFFCYLLNLYKKYAKNPNIKPCIAYLNSNFRPIVTDLKQFINMGKSLGINVINAKIEDIEIN